MASDNSPTQVLHPAYLDIPMMISFLAALTDGVAFEGETISRSTSGSEREGEAGAGIKLPSLGSMFGFDLSGRMRRKDHGEQGEEMRAVRQHTAASLFNSLHRAFHENGSLRVVSDTEALAEVDPGDL